MELFEGMRAETGRKKIEDSIYRLNTGPAADKHGWMLPFMYLLTRQSEKALSEGQRYFI